MFKKRADHFYFLTILSLSPGIAVKNKVGWVGFQGFLSPLTKIKEVTHR
jgi:hypothetical protein